MLEGLDQMILSFALLQSTHCQDDRPLAPTKICPCDITERGGLKPFRINARMKQSNALFRKLPALSEDTARIAAVGDDIIRTPEDAPGHPRQLPARCRQVHFFAVNVDDIGYATKPFQKPSQKPFRQTLAAMQLLNVI